MKSIKVYKLGAALVFACLVITSCPSPFLQSYYIQQQNRSAGNETGNEQEDPGNGDTPIPSEPEPLEPGKISMFSIILPDGKIAEPNNDTTVHDQLAGKLNVSDGFPFDTFPTAKFADWKISSNFSASNVPEPKYSGTVTWESAPENKNPEREKYGGNESASAGGNSISYMTYYRYCGKNPFNLYTSETYDVYGEDGKPTGQKEALMKRFIFYRFTGKGGGVVGLDNYLVAVDTYTKLVFAFAKPIGFTSVFGNQVPTKWASVDTHSTGPGGKKYRFYQYDPAGYVSEDGAFHMSTAYKNNLSSGNYDPVYTGKSPYIGYVGNASGENNGYVISGTLTVKAQYLKNISVTDAWGDHGNADGTDWPEFIYGIRSRSYEGTAVPQWNVLSSYRANEQKIMPNKAKHIKIGTKLPLGGSKEYKFEGSKAARTLELDARIIEIDITKGSNDVITEYEEPIVYLKYDSFSQSWKPSGTNGPSPNGPIDYDKNFELAVGQTKNFVITLRAPEGEQMQLCYELSWSTSGGSSEKPVFGVRLQKNDEDTQYHFSGDNGAYTIEYIDTSDESAPEAKTVSFALNVFNLKPGVPLKAIYKADNADFPVNPVFKAGDTVLTEPVFTTEDSVIDVLLTLPSKVGFEQTGKIVFSLKDENAAYDMPNSPDKIEVTVIRRAYKIIPAAQLSISHPSLKNISIWDLGADGPKGGYKQAEFSYELKTRYNDKEWKIFSTNNGGKKSIAWEETGDLGGASDYTVAKPHNGTHTVLFSAEIWEKDSTGSSDVIVKHEKPVIRLGYDPLTDSWKADVTLPAYFEDLDGKWEVKSVTMDELKRGEKKTLTIAISAYIWDLVNKSNTWLPSIKTAEWGDMELSFDVEWK